ncbi:MAG TPA: Hsp33 family molecular chaperone HslO [Geobacteraceae bacterium]
MSDYLVRIITKAGTVRALACVTTGLVSEACRRHGTRPTASAALGRALTGGALFGALLKTGQRVALRFEGNGPLRKVVVEAESNGAVSGYVGESETDLPDREGKLDVAGALGRAGFLTVTKDLGLKEPYKGMVQLYASEIAEDLAYYLTSSEQIPSAVGLGVMVAPDGSIAAAGGFLVQALPPHDEDVVDLLMERIGQLPQLSGLLAGGATPEDLLARLFADIPYDTLEKRALAFHCSCSREKVERALIAMGAEELRHLMEREEETAVTCEFCRESYRFGRDELGAVLAGTANEVEEKV